MRSTPLNALTRERVAELVKTRRKGRHGDGGLLYLYVPGEETDKRSGATIRRAPAWIIRYKSPTKGRVRDYQIGPELDYSLSAARAKAAEPRRQLDDGIDALDARDQAHADRKVQRQVEEQQRERASATLQAMAEEL